MNRETLIRCIQSGQIMHAVLFAGPEGAGRRALTHVAASVYLFGEEQPERLENCPDYMELQPPYIVEMIRTLTQSMAAQAFSHGRRVFALLDAHLMNASCQNALLKSLEEPPENTLVLLSGSEAGLLPTIRSRCAIVRLGAGSVADVRALLEAEDVPPDRAALCAVWADGVAGMARRYAADAYQTFRADAADCLETALFGGSPFTAASQLLQTPVCETDEKQKQETVNAPLLLEIWQSLLRDALLTQTGGAPLQNPDQKKLTGRMAQRFTTRRIQGIIHILSDGRRRLSLGASGRLTVDSVLAALMEKENKRT